MPKTIVGRRVAFLSLLAATLMALSPASATLIVDTGQPSEVRGGWTLQRDQFGNYTFQALRFDLDRTTTITSVEAWLYGIFNDYTNTLTAVLYDANAAGAPDVPLQRANFAAAYAVIGWYGPNDLNWTVEPGTYWLAIEVPETNVFFGVLPIGAPHPLQWRATHAFLDGIDYPYDPMPTDVIAVGATFGLRVNGDQAVEIPEPLSAWLFSIAVFGLLTSRRMTFLGKSAPSVEMG